jgi:hypothetical protein
MPENHWRALYQAAVFEVDPEKVGARAEAAELAINTHVFAGQQHISGDERADMQHALSALGVLKLESEESAIANAIAPNRAAGRKRQRSASGRDNQDRSCPD